MSCVFLVFVPMLGALALAGLWLFKTKQVSVEYLTIIIAVYYGRNMMHLCVSLSLGLFCKRLNGLI